MEAIERENASLRCVLPKEYDRPALDKQRLGELIDLIGTIAFRSGDEPRDVLGRVYELLPRPVRLEGRQEGRRVLHAPLGRADAGRGDRALPGTRVYEEIDALVTPLPDRAEAAEDESETLAELRDTLLPKLISGEVRLRADGEANVA